MDQMKVVLAAIKKHHFWLLCVVAVLLGFGIWWSATAAIAKRIEERSSELKGTYEKVVGIRGGGSHPNEDTNQAIQKRHDELTDNVFKAWTAFYREQEIRNRWPKELGREFVDYVESLGPDDVIPSDFRDTYMYFIRNHFPEMIEIVEIRLPVARDEDGKPKKDAEGNPIKIDPFESSTGQGNFGGRAEMGAGMAGMAGMRPAGAMGGPGEGSYVGRSTTGREELVGKVDWNTSDLKRIRGNFYWTTQPTTIQVRLAQEDLWVYEALLRIIRQTNAHARSHHNAAVKEILALEIGQKAAVAFSQSRVRSGGSSSAGGMEGMAGMGGMQGMMDGGMEGRGEMGGMQGMMSGAMGGMQGMAGSEMPGAMSMAGGEEGGTQRGAATTKSPEELWKERLINYRYVDQDGMPLAVSDPEPFAEFRMMPVRMLLRADQRRISKLLVNCANSEMPVEVCRVAINPGKGGSLNLGGSGAGMGMTGALGGMTSGIGAAAPGGDTGLPGAFGGGGGQYEQGGGMGFGIGQTRGGSRDQQTTYDVDLEVQGIIYLFNPPDRGKLGTGSAGEAMAAGPGGAPAAAPVAPAAGSPATPPAAAPTTPPAAPPAAGVTPGTPPAAPAGAPTAPATPPGVGGANP